MRVSVEDLTTKFSKLRQQGSKYGLLPKHQAKFLQFDRASQAEINEDAVAQDAQFDGLHAIITNSSNPLPAVEIIAKYRELWQIEDCFRTNKHDLKIRLMYHWKDRRIKAHLMICFMAFCCLQELRFRLRSRAITHTLPELLTQLEQHRLTILYSKQADHASVVITQPLTSKMNAILRTVGVHWPRQSFVLPARQEPA